MKFLTNILIISLFPLLAAANGIHLTEYTLSSSILALMAKLLVVNKAKTTAKIQILKVFGNSDQFQTKQEIEIKIYQRVQMEENKWVKENKYWDSTENFKIGQEVFLVANGSSFEVVQLTEKKLEKFQLIYSPEKLSAKLSNLDLRELLALAKDRDFEVSVAKAIVSRNLPCTSELAVFKDGEAFYRLTRAVYDELATDKKNEFLAKMAEQMPKQEDKISLFVTLLRNITTLEDEFKIELLNSMGLRNDQVLMWFYELQYSLRSKIDQGKIALIQKVYPLYLESLKFGRMDMSKILPEDFYRHLASGDKEKFILAMAAHHRQKPDFRSEGVFDEMAKIQNLAAAWELAQMDFHAIHESRRVLRFSQVLRVLLAKENLNDKRRLEQIFKFTWPWLDKTYSPMKIDDELKKDYQRIGGIIYEDLPQLQVWETKNAEELAGKFRTYFEVALLVGEYHIHDEDKYSTIQLKIVKKWGELKPLEKGRASASTEAVVKAAMSSDSFIARISEESIKALKSIKGQRVIFAVKASSSSFSVLGPQYEEAVDTAFRK